MQNENPFFDGLSKLLTDAAGAAKGARDDLEAFVKQKLEKMLADMDLVRREEFEAVKAMAAKAREENEQLEARVKELERRAGVETNP